MQHSNICMQLNTLSVRVPVQAYAYVCIGPSNTLYGVTKDQNAAVAIGVIKSIKIANADDDTFFVQFTTDRGPYVTSMEFMQLWPADLGEYCFEGFRKAVNGYMSSKSKGPRKRSKFISESICTIVCEQACD